MKAAADPVGGSGEVLCRVCPVVANCLPGGLTAGDRAAFEHLIVRQHRLAPQQSLFRLGDSFHALYAIQDGHLKTSVLDAQCREHVLNFHLPGEIVGVDAIYLNRHVTGATALTAAVVCELPFDELRRFARQHVNLDDRMYQTFSRATFHISSLAVDSSAAERLAAFLLGMLARYRARGQRTMVLELAMERQDIANHLRIAPETVSRVLSRLVADGLIAVDGRHIDIRDVDKLRQLASSVNPYAW
jgi:CRP/FNR family transcriptional regulator